MTADRWNRRVAEVTPARRGLSLVETLVVLGIFGLLASMILPAVQAARSAARRIQCQNQLRQLVSGVVQYHDLYSVFPPWVVNCGAAGSDCNYDGALTLILPFLEHADKCDLISENTKRIPLLECPADGILSGVESPVSYRLNVGPGENSGSLLEGPFPPVADKSTRMRDIIDGTSQTAACSEQLVIRSGGNEQTALSAASRYIWRVNIPPVSDATSRNPSTPNALRERSAQTELSINDCLEGPRIFEPLRNFHYVDWRVSNTSATTYSHWLPPNSPNCRPSYFAFDTPYLASNQGASSEHSGGVNLAYLDGHVVFTSQAIDRQLWRAIGTRNGGESLNGGAY